MTAGAVGFGLCLSGNPAALSVGIGMLVAAFTAFIGTKRFSQLEELHWGVEICRCVSVAVGGLILIALALFGIVFVVAIFVAIAIASNQ